MERPGKSRLLLGAILLVPMVSYALKSSAHAETISTKQRSVFSPYAAKDAYFSPSNLREITLLSDDGPLGEMSVYQSLTGTIIPIGQLSSLMGWHINLDQSNRVAQGSSPVNGNKVLFAPSIHTVMVGAESYNLDQNQILFYQNDIYLDIDALQRLLDIEILMNRSTAEARVSFVKAISENKEAFDPQSEAFGPAVPEPDWVMSHTEEDVWVLQLQINDILMVDFVDALQRGDKTYLPFSGITEILEFPIQVDIETVQAHGWFVREHNTVNVNGHTAIISGKTYHLGTEQIIKNEEDFYIEKNLLAEWFSLNFEIDPQTMLLSIHSETPFPFEEIFKRQQLYSVLGRKKALKEKEKNYQPYEIPYTIASSPVVDVTLNSAYDKLSEQKVTSTYNIQGSGDLAYLTSHFYASGDLHDHALTDLRFSLGRDDYTKNLLGLLGASSFRFGDINSISIPQIAQTGEGRGLTVTNRDLNRTDKFDTTDFIGDSIPGWDVELYRNDVLIDAQVVEADGRYEFTDVPILFGNNIFRLLLLGPQGQIEEEVKHINVNSSILNKGQFTYNVSADQKSQRLVEYREFEPNHPKSTRVAAEAEYGITKWLTGAFGFSQTPLESGNHEYVNGGLRTSLKGVLSSFDYAYNTKTQGHSGRLISFANFLGTNLRFTYKAASNFTSEEASNFNDPMKREISLDLDRTFNIPKVGELGASVFLQKNMHESNLSEEVIRARLSKSFRGFNITNTLEQNTSDNAERRVSGSFSARGRVHKNVFALSSDYTLKPYKELSQLKLSWLRNWTSSILNNLALTRRYGSDINYELEDTITFDMNKYKFFVTGRMDNDAEKYIGVGLNFSLGQYPDDQWRFSSRARSNTGVAVAKAFIDDDYDLQRDDGEKSAENIVLKIGSRYYQTDEFGVAVAENLDTKSPIYLYADQTKFSDQAMGPGVEGYRVNLRPGYPANIDYPIFVTAELEGFIEPPEDIQMPREMQISLVNTEGQNVSTTGVQFDGYFLFRNVLPGAYYVKIPENVLMKKQLVYENEAPVIITNKDDFVTTIVQLVSEKSENADVSD
ncbi:MAG: hypothetical protein H6937_13505 [Burkholderiales bacterium]|nr:hypothetical protein [Rhodospirillales bacterium]MCP5246904.1 hypothetical protein [Burkholderiales bacterium]